MITFFNPGANLFVVVQTSLASGRRAGVLTGLGVALGDALLFRLPVCFGLATLITQCEEIFFAYQNRRRRLSLMVCVVQHAPPVNTANEHTTTTD